jgi:hypothetical protein
MAVGCVIIVAVIEAYEQALSEAPKASAKLPHVDGWWHFAPLALLIIGGVFWAVGRIPKPLAASQQDALPRQDHNKVWANKSPVELTAFYRDHTSFDADNLAAPYIDTWLSISGTVYNASIENGIPTLFIDNVEGVSLIQCRFGKASQKKISICKKGDAVNITGKITRIQGSSISLNKCEFV